MPEYHIGGESPFTPEEKNKLIDDFAHLIQKYLEESGNTLQDAVYNAFDSLAARSSHFPRIVEILKDKNTYKMLDKIIKKQQSKKLADEIAANGITISMAKLASVMSAYDPDSPDVAGRKIFDKEKEILTNTIPGLKGGADTSSSPTKEPKQVTSKQLIKFITDVKKDARTILDTLDGIQSKYNKSQSKTEKGTTNFDNIKSIIGKLKGETPKGEKPKEKTTGGADEQPVSLTPEESHVLGIYKSLADEGKWINDALPKQIDSIKDLFKSIQGNMQKIFESDPNDTSFTDYSKKFNIIVDGDLDFDYDKAVDKPALTGNDEKQKEIIKKVYTMGFNTIMVKSLNQIKSTYEELYNIVKPQGESLKTKEEHIGKRAAATIYDPRSRGGAVPVKYVSEDSVEYLDRAVELIEDNLLSKIVRPLSAKINSTANPIYASLGATPGLLDDIYKKYLQSKVSDGKLISNINLESTLDANGLIPAKVLQITTIDKVIFIFTIILMRMLCNAFTEYMIGKGYIKTIWNALLGYIICYTVLFAILVIAVNLDLYRWRIVFNYINLHSNQGVVLTHLITVWLITFVVLMIISNVNIPVSGLINAADSNEEKSYLMYRVEVITMCIWIFMIIVVAVM